MSKTRKRIALIAAVKSIHNDLKAAYELVESLNNGDSDGEAWSIFDDAATEKDADQALKDAFVTITDEISDSENFLGRALECAARLLVQLGVDPKEVER